MMMQKSMVSGGNQKLVSIYFDQTNKLKLKGFVCIDCSILLVESLTDTEME
jgi:hypothetical protein